MKMVHLDIYFKLPDDFEGDLNDAIEEVVKYRRSIKNHNKNYQYDPDISNYNNWWNMVYETDRKLSGSVSMHEHINDSWVDMEKVL